MKKGFPVAHSEIFKPVFCSMWKLYLDKEHAFNLQKLLKKGQMKTTVEIERTIEQQNNEQIILKLLTCANHFHGIISCNKNCKYSIFLNIVTGIVVSLNCPSEKVCAFQSYCKISHKEFIN